MRALLSAFVCLLAACGSSGGPSMMMNPPDAAGPVQNCRPNTSQDCTCDDGSDGIQTCKADGSGYDACMCSVSTACSPANPHGDCTSGKVCTDGVCMTPVPPCSAGAPNGTCQTGQTCQSGACCENSQVCGGDCCSTNSICVSDTATGHIHCAAECVDSGECPSSAACCTLLGDGNGGFSGQSVCADATVFCRCINGDPCPDGACAPVTDSDGLPHEPYICKPNDGTAYNGCHGVFTSCDDGWCCVKDTAGNEFCAVECTDDSTCGTGHCDAFSFSGSSCEGPKACGE